MINSTLFLLTALISTGRVASGHERTGVTPVLEPAPRLVSTSKISRQETSIKSLEEVKGYAIPFSYLPPSRPLLTIQAKINGSKPLTFVLDTGWEATLFLLPWAAKTLKIEAQGEKQQMVPSDRMAQSAGSSTVELVASPSAPNISFQVDPVWVGEMPVLQKYPGPRIAGIIGGNLFQVLTSRFDFEKKTVTFYPEQHPPLKLGSESISLPLKKSGDRILPNVQLQLSEGTQLDFVVDTGSNMLTIPESISDKLSFTVKGETQHSNLAGSHQVKEVVLSSFLLGNKKLASLNAVLVPKMEQGLLGLNVLSLFRVTIDTRNGFLILEPRK